MQKEKIGIIGHGYVGKAISDFFADNYEVYIYDPNQYGINQGRILDSKNKIVADKTDINECDLVVICVPTPMRKNGECDISIVEKTFEWLKAKLILIKSTVPPKELLEIERNNPGICFSPEYIGEGKYFVPYWKYPHPTKMKYHNFMIVGGDRAKAQEIIELFMPILGPSCKYLKTDIATASLVKYMENSWGATKVTFCNEWYQIAKAFGVDYQELRELFLLDGRTERMHTMISSKNPGFSGKCYPKDVNAIAKFSETAGYRPELIKQVLKSNDKFRK